MLLAIDQGTRGTTCLVFDHEGELLGRGHREFTQHFPRPGWVEHDAAEIWDVSHAVAGEALEDAGVEPGELDAVGIANQRETVVAWDPGTGEPLHRALVWQDRRTDERCHELRAAGHRASCSGTRIEWLLRNVDGLAERARDGRAVFGTIDSWLLFKLTGEHATEPSNASRTMLLDGGRGAWDGELLDRFGIPARSLPELRPSCGELGVTSGDFHGHAVPVSGVLGDRQAALFGQRCMDPGEGKATYGTGACVLQNAGPQAPPTPEGLLGTVAWQIGNQTTYALEAAIFVDGWDPGARATPETGHAPEARAALEAMAYQTCDAVRAMESASGVALEQLRADGGATAHRWLMQFQADVLGVPVTVPEVPETTALGAALAAGVGAGHQTLDDVRTGGEPKATYEPRMSEDERRTLLDGWHRGLQRSKGWAR